MKAVFEGFYPINQIRNFITTPTMFPAHKYDGKCAALATGLCATKLKLIPDSVDLDIWKNLSKAIGALPGGGAQMATINKYYTDKGFGVTVAANKDGETAIQQAKKALDRGCDVKIVFNDNAKTKGHVDS